jgi:integrase
MSVSVAEAVDGFLEHKRAIGRKYHSEAAELRLLVRFTAQRRVVRLDRITPAVLDEFLASRPRLQPRSFNHLRGVVVCLLDWAVAQGLLETSPLRSTRRRVSATRAPFILEPDQVRRLLDAAAALPDNARAAQRGPTYHALFALCYGLGLRAGEACHLRVGDIDTDRSVLVVVGGKFGKSRLVPHGPRVAELIAAQLERRCAGRLLDDDTPLFSFNGRRPITTCTASQVFHRLVATLDLEVPPGVRAPCLHSLRHSFAVGTLLRWYRDGIDPSTKLFQLATFMGHVDPTSTAVYLTVTSALLDEANRRFESFAQPTGAQR